MALGLRLGDQRGFTLIEVLVAASLLVIGVLGTMALVDASNATTNQNKGREGATNLAREVVEGSRSIGYEKLEPFTVHPELQAMPGLADVSPGPGWGVKRRGIDYTVDVSVCSVDDPKDGLGSHAGVTFCADSSATGTADPQSRDFKRVTVDISWESAFKTQSLRQVALIATDNSAGPPVTALVATAPVVADPAAPVITGSAITSVTFRATVPAGVSSVVYSLDGEDKGDATVEANGTDWTFTLPISALTDGGYSVSVRAVDARGVAGPSFAIPLKLIRSQPVAPSGFTGGPNTINVSGTPTSVVELEWRANSERNVIGYRVYNASGALVCPADLLTIDLKLTCIDFANAGGTYSVVALYRDAGGTVQEGPASTVKTGLFTHTYYFKKTTANTSDATKCLNAFRKRDMAIGYTGSDPEETYDRTSSNVSLNFCSPASTGGETIQGGTTTVSGYVSNSAGSTCNISASLYKNGTTLLGSASVTVPNASANTLRTWVFPTTSTALASGDRLNLYMNWSQVKACDSTILRYGGTANRSSVRTPGTEPLPPGAPTGLSATTLADGTTQLSWSAPASGNPVSFYRIYRDGINYTNRLDTTGSGTDTTYVDDPGGTTHTYHVTSVGPRLAESAMAGPVTK